MPSAFKENDRLPFLFFNALAKITDNTGSNTFKVCACSFLYHLAHALVSLGISWRFGSYANGVTFVLSSAGAWATIPTAVRQKRAMGSLPSTAWHALRLG
jgi:hypothetical protein